MLWRIKWLAETAMIPIWLISEWIEEKFSRSRDMGYKVNPSLQKAVAAVQDEARKYDDGLRVGDGLELTIGSQIVRCRVIMVIKKDTGNRGVK